MLLASFTAYSHSVRDDVTVFMGERKVCSHIRTQAECVLSVEENPSDGEKEIGQ